MTIVNLTPHPINVYSEDGKTIIATIPPSGIVARVSTKTVEGEPINGIPTQRTEYGEVVDLPQPQEGTYYIVSYVVRSAVPNRTDLLVPATGPADKAIRDEQGRIKGITRFNR